MGKYDKFLADTLEQMYEQTNRKHDAYYHEGKGALFVPEGYELTPHNVVYRISEIELRMMSGSIFF